MNVVILKGNVGSDVELQKTAGGTSVARVTLATTDGFGDNKKTNWHNLVMWGKTAEVVSEHVTKGSQIAVQGAIEYQSWEKDGVKQYKTVINCSSFEFCGGKNDGAKGNAPANKEDPKPTSAPVPEEIDDLPF